MSLGRLKGAISYTRWALRLFDAPGRNEVVYGYGPDLWPSGGAEGHVWYCGRCRTSQDEIATLSEAFDAAKGHAGTHDAVQTSWGRGRP